MWHSVSQMLRGSYFNFSIVLSFSGYLSSGSQMEPQCHRPPLTSKQVQCDHWAHIKQGSTFQLPERRDPVQLFFRVTWACSDTGTWKLFWVTPRCCKSMRAKTLMKKLFPIPHFLPFTYHGTSKVDGNVESKGLLSFYCSISELSVLLLLDISFFPFFPCNFPSSKISNFFQILK